MRRRDLIQPFRLAMRPLARPGQRLAIGVSGGPDSIALLDLAHRAAPRLGIELVVGHLDHGWRAESAADAQLVQEAAAARGLTCVVERLDGAPQTEAAGRAARLDFFARLAVDGVLLGHTADDQSETVVTHLLRGSGLDGLAAMRPETSVCDVRVLRPLLGLRRAELRTYCVSRGLRFVDDPSNHDPRFRRNRIRHELLPLIEEIAPGASGALARLTELAVDEQAVLGAAVELAWPAAVERSGDDPVAVRRPAFRRLLPAVQRGVLRRLANDFLGPAPDLSFERLEAARTALLRGRGGAVVEWPHGARLTVAGQRGIFVKERT